MPLYLSAPISATPIYLVMETRDPIGLFAQNLDVPIL